MTNGAQKKAQAETPAWWAETASRDVRSAWSEGFNNYLSIIDEGVEELTCGEALLGDMMGHIAAVDARFQGFQMRKFDQKHQIHKDLYRVIEVELNKQKAEAIQKREQAEKDARALAKKQEEDMKAQTQQKLENDREPTLIDSKTGPPKSQKSSAKKYRGKRPGAHKNEKGSIGPDQESSDADQSYQEMV